MGIRFLARAFPGLVCTAALVFAPAYLLQVRPAEVDPLEAAIAEAAKAGIPMDEASMRASVAIPPEDDALPELKPALELARKIRTMDAQGKQLDAGEVADALSAEPAILDHLSRAVNKPRVTFGLYPGISFPEYAQFKQLCKVLTAAARGEAKRGHWAEAQRDLLYSNQLSVWLGRTHGIVGALVQIAVDAINLAACRNIVSEGNGSPASVTLARSYLRAVPPPYDLRNAFPFEPQLSSTLVTHPEKSMATSDLFGDLGQDQPEKLTSGEEKRLRLDVAKYIMVGLAQSKAVRTTLSFPQQYDALIQATCDESARQKADAEDSPGISAETVELFKNATVKKLADELFASVCIWALEQHRKTGSIPEKYDGPEPLNDPRGFQCRYVKEADGFMVYWFGPDGKDDGGLEPGRGNGKAKGSDDFGYRYFPQWPPGQR